MSDSSVIISLEASTAAGVSAAICAFLGIIGNSVVLSALIWGPSKDLKKHPTMPLFVSLAVSDLIFSTVNLPITAARFFVRGRVLSFWPCRLFPFFYYSNVLISVFSISLIAVFRLIGINYPTTAAEVISLKRAWIAVGAIWAEAFLLMAFPLFGIWGTVGYVSATFSCTILPDPKTGRNPTLFLIIVGTAIPFAATLISYLLVCAKVKISGRRMRESEQEPRLSWRARQGSSVARATLSRERQLTRTVVLVCASFFVCFLPSEIVALVDPMPPNFEHSDLHVACYVLFWCSAFLNPVIYCACSRQFRQEIQSVFRMLCSRKSVSKNKIDICERKSSLTVWYVQHTRTTVMTNLEEEQESMLNK